MFGPATGYEIKKLFEEGPFSHFYEASFGSIYPALSRLTEEGLISCTEERGEGKPDKKIYELTPAGADHLTEVLTNRDPAPDKFRSEFMIHMMFSFLLPPGRAEALIQKRLTVLQEKLEQLETANNEDIPPSGQFVKNYGIAVMRAEIAYLKANRPFINQPPQDAQHMSQRVGQSV